FDFLTGLNVEFEPIRAQILSTKPLPSLEDAFSSIQSEDTRRAAMALPAPQERSALYSDFTTANVAFRGKTSGAQARPIPVCDYCGKEKHTRDRCWKLHGRPGDKKKCNIHSSLLLIRLLFLLLLVNLLRLLFLYHLLRIRCRCYGICSPRNIFLPLQICPLNLSCL
ncbi:hypothetical protein CFOL_v3_13899, partial [Cephalotus follicularis]